MLKWPIMRIPYLFRLLGAALTIIGVAAAAAAESLSVVATVPPVHSLVAQVMVGAGRPGLLIPAGASPHAFSLKPSGARALQEADLVFWVGPGLETFLEKPLKTLASGARTVALGRFDASPDRQVWLDPAKAAVMVDAVVEALRVSDPAQAALYAANGRKAAAELAALQERLSTTLRPVAGRAYVVYHDAYSHFEERFGLKALAAVIPAPERRPGAGRLARIRGAMIEAGAICLFGEPQFRNATVDALARETGARIGELDPLGVGLRPGPGLYASLMERLTGAFVGCLRRPG